MKKILSLFILGCIGLFPVLTYANDVYYVSTGGNDNNDGTTQATAFKTIIKATAVLKENTPSTIYLEENATFQLNKGDTILIMKNREVSIIGKNTTIQPLDEPGKGWRIMSIYADTDVKLKGIVFKNGCTRDGVPGGAVFFEGNKLEIDSCSFIDNQGNASAGAIGSRGKDLIITNSVFDGNHVFGGYGVGATLFHCGIPTVLGGKKDGSLIIRNCSFTNSQGKADTAGDVISFMHSYRESKDPLQAKYGKIDPYCNVGYFELTNCLFKDNTSLSTTLSPGAADISFAMKQAATDKFYANLANNTFYNSRALAIPNVFGKIHLINNVFYSGPSSEDRLNYVMCCVIDRKDPIQAHNNVMLGKMGYGSQIFLDPCFNAQKEEYKNTMITDVSQLSKLGLAASANKDEFVYCLPIESASSILIDKGLSTFTFDGKELVPATDVRGNAVHGASKDIGAFEYTGTVGIFNPVKNDANLFAVGRMGDNAVIKNLTEKNLTIEVRLLDGRAVYSSKVESELYINKSEISVAGGVLIFTATDGTNTQSIKTIVF